MGAIDELNITRRETGKPAAAVDLAFHLGEALYGNVGAVDCLAFTVIGPAVNETARIEALCEPLGRRVLVSAALAAVVATNIALYPSATMPCEGYVKCVITTAWSLAKPDPQDRCRGLSPFGIVLELGPQASPFSRPARRLSTLTASRVGKRCNACALTFVASSSNAPFNRAIWAPRTAKPAIITTAKAMTPKRRRRWLSPTAPAEVKIRQFVAEPGRWGCCAKSGSNTPAEQESRPPGAVGASRRPATSFLMRPKLAERRPLTAAPEPAVFAGLAGASFRSTFCRRQ